MGIERLASLGRCFYFNAKTRRRKELLGECGLVERRWGVGVR